MVYVVCVRVWHSLILTSSGLNKTPSESLPADCTFTVDTHTLSLFRVQGKLVLCFVRVYLGLTVTLTPEKSWHCALLG